MFGGFYSGKKKNSKIIGFDKITAIFPDFTWNQLTTCIGFSYGSTYNDNYDLIPYWEMQFELGRYVMVVRFLNASYLQIAHMELGVVKIPLHRFEVVDMNIYYYEKEMTFHIRSDKIEGCFLDFFCESIAIVSLEKPTE